VIASSGATLSGCVLSALVLCALVLGCHGGPHRPAAAAAAAGGDAPYELADELDFAERADALARCRSGAARTALARASWRRCWSRASIARSASGRLERASAALVRGLAELWARRARRR
jgi:hypothetical protein